jgi:uncharacterized protein (DUF3084 family)
MESVKRLEEACKEVQKDLRNLDGRETALRSSVDSLEIKRSGLLSEIAAIEASMTEAKAKIEDLSASRERELRAKSASIDEREAMVKALQAQAVVKGEELDRLEREAIESKIKYETLAGQVQGKLDALKEKEAQVQALFSK